MRDKDISGMMNSFKTALDSMNAVSGKPMTFNMLRPTPGVNGNPPTPVNVLTASVVIAPENLNRKGFIIFNNSGNSCYVSLASVSVAARCTRLIATYASWEMIGNPYTGPISSIRNSGSGECVVWEIT